MDTNLEEYLDTKFQESLKKSMKKIESKLQGKIINMSGDRKAYATEMWFTEFRQILKQELLNIPIKANSNIENARKTKIDNYKQQLSIKKTKIDALIYENPKITISKLAENLAMSRYGLTKNKELRTYINELKTKIQDET